MKAREGRWGGAMPAQTTAQETETIRAAIKLVLEWAVMRLQASSYLDRLRATEQLDIATAALVKLGRTD